MITLIDTADSKIVVSTQDPAILLAPEPKDGEEAPKGTTKDDLKRYAETLDCDCLTFKEGSTPTQFVIRALDTPEDSRARARSWQDKSVGENSQAMSAFIFVEYFKAGCTHIRNFARVGDNVEVKDELIKKIPASVVREIGFFIFQISSAASDAGSEKGDDEKK